MQAEGHDLPAAQLEHWEAVHTGQPAMYGGEPSEPARYAAGLFAAAGARDVLELGAGHGRDALFFARRGFAVQATDFSPAALDQLTAAADDNGLGVSVRVLVHDAREPLPLPAASVDAVYAHMLLCMALSTAQLHALVGEVGRVLRPGGTFVYTVRHTGDAHYGMGTAHGEDIFEHDGFAVHFFGRDLVDGLAEGWELREVEAFTEGELPRLLWRVTQTRPLTAPDERSVTHSV